MKDQGEFLTHLLKHQNDLRAFIGSIVRDRSACDDVFQDVALILWRKFDQYDSSRSFGAWARGIASRRIMQTFAKNRRLPVVLSPEAIEAVAAAHREPSPDHLAEESALRHCMDQLPEKSKRLVDLRYEQAMKLREIAEEVKSSLDAVHKALSRIREGLRRCVEKQLMPESGISA